MNFLIIFLFIGISLQTFYFYQFNAPLISLGSFLFLGVLMLNRFKLKINASNYSFYFYLLILYFSFLSLIYFNDKLVFTKLIGFIIVLLGCIISNILFYKNDIVILIKYYLTFHLLFFYFQFFSFYFFKIHIDFLYPITGEAQRVFGGSFDLPYFNSFMRPSGLFNEPGTYVTFVAPFVVLFGRWNYIFNRQSKYIYLFSLISLFLSFSVFGFIFGVLILLFASIYNLKVRFFIFLSLFILIVIPYVSYRFFIDTAISDSDTGLIFRELFLSESYKFIKSDLGAFFFGSGHLSSNPKAFFTASFNDVGLIPYLMHFSGPFLTLLLLLFLFLRIISLDKYSICGLLILFISKISILTPFFPFILTLLLWPITDSEIDHA